MISALKKHRGVPERKFSIRENITEKMLSKQRSGGGYLGVGGSTFKEDNST